MSEPMVTPPASQGDSWLEPGANNVKLVYICYIVGFFIGISTLVGVVFAYLNRGRAGPVADSHYTWAIRTFWIAILFGFISLLLMIVAIGFLTAIATVVWVVVRVVIGLQAIGRGEPIKNPTSWML